MALPNKTQPLDERITALRAEIDKFIDAMVAEDVKACPGVPAGVLRNLITVGRCQCATYLDLKAKDDEAVAKEDAA